MSFLAYPATENQKKIVAVAGELADVFAQRAAKDDWEGHFHRENFEDLHRAGYLALTVPRDFGGGGASLLDVVLAQERLARGDASTALIASMQLINVARFAYGVSGPNALLEQIYRDVVQEGALINSAASEPATGSPSRGGRPTTTARRQTDGSWLINGHKNFTTGSNVLKYFIVSCSLEDEVPESAGLKPLSADRGNFLVAAGTPGLRVEDTWNTLGMRGSASNDVLLENVHVGPTAYMDEYLPISLPKGHGPAWISSTVAIYLGIATAARDAAVQFAQKRRPNSLNQSIATVPHIQEKIAQMELTLLQSRAVLFGVIEQYMHNPASVHESQFAAAKYLVNNHAVEVVDLAMRVVGGASLSLAFPLQRYYRDVRAGLHQPPMDDVTIAQLARHALEIKESTH